MNEQNLNPLFGIKSSGKGHFLGTVKSSGNSPKAGPGENSFFKELANSTNDITSSGKQAVNPNTQRHAGLSKGLVDGTAGKANVTTLQLPNGQTSALNTTGPKSLDSETIKLLLNMLNDAIPGNVVPQGKAGQALNNNTNVSANNNTNKLGDIIADIEAAMSKDGAKGLANLSLSSLHIGPEGETVDLQKGADSILNQLNTLLNTGDASSLAEYANSLNSQGTFENTDNEALVLLANALLKNQDTNLSKETTPNSNVEQPIIPSIIKDINQNIVNLNNAGTINGQAINITNTIQDTQVSGNAESATTGTSINNGPVTAPSTAKNVDIQIPVSNVGKNSDIHVPVTNASDVAKASANNGNSLNTNNNTQNGPINVHQNVAAGIADNPTTSTAKNADTNIPVTNTNPGDVAKATVNTSNNTQNGPINVQQNVAAGIADNPTVSTSKNADTNIPVTNTNPGDVAKATVNVSNNTQNGSINVQQNIPAGIADNPTASTAKNADIQIPVTSTSKNSDIQIPVKNTSGVNKVAVNNEQSLDVTKNAVNSEKDLGPAKATAGLANNNNAETQVKKPGFQNVADISSKSNQPQPKAVVTSNTQTVGNNINTSNPAVSPGNSLDVVDGKQAQSAQTVDNSLNTSKVNQSNTQPSAQNAFASASDGGTANENASKDPNSQSGKDLNTQIADTNTGTKTNDNKQNNFIDQLTSQNTNRTSFASLKNGVQRADSIELQDAAKTNQLYDSMKLAGNGKTGDASIEGLTSQTGKTFSSTFSNSETSENSKELNTGMTGIKQDLSQKLNPSIAARPINMDQTSEKRNAEIADNIAHNAKLFLRGVGSSSITMRINPPELGNIKLQFDIVDDVLKAKIVVENPSVKNMIERDIPRLRELITSADVDLGKLDVQLQDKDGDKLGLMNRDPQTWTEGRGQSGLENQENDTSNNENDEMQAHDELKPGSINFLA